MIKAQPYETTGGLLGFLSDAVGTDYSSTRVNIYQYGATGGTVDDTVLYDGADIEILMYSTV